MSKTLGPIHYMLFNRIRIQDDFCTYLAKKADEVNSEFYADVEKRTFIIPDKDLSELVDSSSIHNSLNEMIGEVEYKLAYIVAGIIEYSIFTFDEVVELAREYGRIVNFKRELTPEEGFGLIFERFLNGMPCDNIVEVKENAGDYITWVDTVDIHEMFWDNLGRDGIEFYKIRAGIIEGMIENTGLKFETNGQYEFTLRAI